jgi:hypothetical protein
MTYELYLDICKAIWDFLLVKSECLLILYLFILAGFGNNRLPRNERYCVYCNMHDMEDEYYFIIICPCYVELRKTYIKPYYYVRPSVHKFLDLLNSTNKLLLKNLALYI